MFNFKWYRGCIRREQCLILHVGHLGPIRSLVLWFKDLQEGTGLIWWLVQVIRATTRCLHVSTPFTLVGQVRFKIINIGWTERLLLCGLLLCFTVCPLVTCCSQLHIVSTFWYVCYTEVDAAALPFSSPQSMPDLDSCEWRLHMPSVHFNFIIS